MIMIESELIIRVGSFIGILCFFAIAEELYPRRKLKLSKKSRWYRNFSLVIINSLVLRFLLPISAASVALIENEYAILNYLQLPKFVSIILCIILLDMIIYFQHRVFHMVSFFWKFHKIHHIDQELDTSSGIRFHPVEIIFSMFIKCLVVLVVGVQFEAVVMFEIILNASSLFNHANINLSNKMDTMLRRLIVTPDMHRIHHSVLKNETNSNYGFNLSCWDRVFGTYKHSATKSQVQIDIGLNEYQDYKKTGLFEILTIPFRRNNYALLTTFLIILILPIAPNLYH